MTQPVTALDSELASKLEELSGLASQIAHCSRELRSTLESDLLSDSAGACALLHAALSNAQDCLSLLQSITPAPVPYVVTSSDGHLIDFPRSPTSPLVPPTEHSSRSPTPVPEDACKSFSYPSTTSANTHDLPALAFLTDQSLPSWPSTPATQRWPHPSISLVSAEAVFEPPTQSPPGGRSVNEYSPLPPLFNPPPRTRHAVSIAELVDEENSPPGTRGGVNRPSRPATTHVNVRMTLPYPPLSICIVDVTPRCIREPECPGGSGVTSPLLSLSRSPPASDRYQRCTTSEVGKFAHRSKRKTVSVTASETTHQRITRSVAAKRKATKEFEMENRPSKRAKSHD